MRIVMCVRPAFDRWNDGMNDRSIIPSSAFRRSVDRGVYSSSSRAVMRIKCEPNWVSIGPCTTSIGALNTTSLNSFTICPGLNVPRSPPFLDDGHVECLVASWANLARNGAPPATSRSISSFNACALAASLTNMCDALALGPNIIDPNARYANQPMDVTTRPMEPYVRSTVSVSAARATRRDARDGGARATRRCAHGDDGVARRLWRGVGVARAQLSVAALNMIGASMSGARATSLPPDAPSSPQSPKPQTNTHVHLFHPPSSTRSTTP